MGKRKKKKVPKNITSDILQTAIMQETDNFLEILKSSKGLPNGLKGLTSDHMTGQEYLENFGLDKRDYSKMTI